MMWVKVHHSYRDVIAICDSELVGKTFEEGKRQIRITDYFFKGEEKNPEEVRELLVDGITEDSTFILVGEQTIKIALEESVIQKEGIVTIQEIPVSLMLL